MCYSAQVVQSMKKLYRELGIRLDYKEALDLFMRRVDDPGVTISRGFEANFESPQNEAEQRIKVAIDEYRARTAASWRRPFLHKKHD